MSVAANALDVYVTVTGCPEPAARVLPMICVVVIDLSMMEWTYLICVQSLLD